MNKHVKIFCDNSTAVTYINAMGGTRSPSCNQITYDLWDWCVNNNTWLTATHIAGVENTEADKGPGHIMTELNGPLKGGF